MDTEITAFELFLNLLEKENPFLLKPKNGIKITEFKADLLSIAYFPDVISGSIKFDEKENYLLTLRIKLTESNTPRICFIVYRHNFMSVEIDFETIQTIRISYTNDPNAVGFTQAIDQQHRGLFYNQILQKFNS